MCAVLALLSLSFVVCMHPKKGYFTLLSKNKCEDTRDAWVYEDTRGAQVKTQRGAQVKTRGMRVRAVCGIVRSHTQASP